MHDYIKQYEIFKRFRMYFACLSKNTYWFLWNWSKIATFWIIQPKSQPSTIGRSLISLSMYWQFLKLLLRDKVTVQVAEFRSIMCMFLIHSLHHVPSWTFPGGAFVTSMHLWGTHTLTSTPCPSALLQWVLKSHY